MLEPELGQTVEFMREMLPSLKPGEKRVIEQVIRDPHSIPDMAAVDLAVHSGSSSATVIRACQSLGFKGFQHLRMLLVRDLGAAAAGEEEELEVEPLGPTAAIARQLKEASQDLDAATRKLDTASLEQAVEVLSQAGRIVMVGSGSSAATIQALQLRSTFTGVHIEAPADPVVQSLACRLLCADDVCLAISDSGMSQTTLAAAEAARKSGAQVIAVTGYARSRLADIADIALTVGTSTSTWRHSALGSNLAQMVVLNAIQLEVAKRRSTLVKSTDLAREEIFDSVVIEAPTHDDDQV